MSEMRIVHAIPLSRGVFRDSLSYFSAQDLNPGAVINVPVRNKTTPALVIDSEPVDDVKSVIRTANYPIRKIKGVKARGLIRPEFIAAAIAAADYFGATLGPTVRSLLPRVILEESGSLDSGELKPAPVWPEYPFGDNHVAIQNTDAERLSYYKSLIRETFAKNGSVFLCLPTAQDLEPVLSQLERGISEYTIVFHSGLAKKEMIERWKKALSLAHPVLIVATPVFLALPRQDLRVIIIDREQAPSYKQLTRPFIDWRTFAEILSRRYQSKLICGDACLRAETLYRAENRELSAGSSLKQRSPSPALPHLVRGQTGLALEEETRQVLSEAILNGQRTFILANRRGLASLVVCHDCGTTVLCHRCESPVALHQAEARDGENEATTLVCHRCGSRRSAKERCANCTSWQLKELGTGTEKVAAELANLFPETKVFRLDSDSAKTARQAIELASRFSQSPGAVLVGTEMALYYLKESVENVLVIAIDNLLALPDFRTREKLFNLLIRLRQLAGTHFLVQTRYETDPIFEYALRGNIISFYRQEVADRQNFAYPPFKLLIKISEEGEREPVRAEMKKLENLLKKYEPVVYPSFSLQGRSRYRLNLLLKLAPQSWPEAELVSVLKSLPPSFIVNVDPTDIL